MAAVVGGDDERVGYRTQGRRHPAPSGSEQLDGDRVGSTRRHTGRRPASDARRPREAGGARRTVRRVGVGRTRPCLASRGDLQRTLQLPCTAQLRRLTPHTARARGRLRAALPPARRGRSGARGADHAVGARGWRRQDRDDGDRVDGTATARSREQTNGCRAESHARTVLHRVACFVPGGQGAVSDGRGARSCGPQAVRCPCCGGRMGRRRRHRVGVRTHSACAGHRGAFHPTTSRRTASRFSQFPDVDGATLAHSERHRDAGTQVGGTPQGSAEPRRQG